MSTSKDKQSAPRADATIQDEINQYLKHIQKLKPEYISMLGNYTSALVKDVEENRERNAFNGPNVTEWLKTLTPEWREWFSKEIEHSRTQYAAERQGKAGAA